MEADPYGCHCLPTLIDLHACLFRMCSLQQNTLALYIFQVAFRVVVHR